MKNIQFLTKSIIVLFVMIFIQANFLKASPVSFFPPDTVEDKLCAPSFPTKYQGKTIYRPGIRILKTSLTPDSSDSIYVRLYAFENLPDTIRLADCASNFPLRYDSLSFTASTRQTISYSLDTNGCPAMHHFIITQYPEYKDTVVANICVVDTPYAFHDTTFFESGIYHFHDTTLTGCDSNTVLILNINPVYEVRDTIAATVCSHDLPFVFGDSSLTAPGIYDIVQHTVAGCDSAITNLTLTVTENIYDTLRFNVCSNEYPLVVDSIHSYNAAGTYYILHEDTLPCHSITTVIINELPSYNDTIRVNWCSADGPYLFADSSFTESTVITFTDSTLIGCDSITTLILNIGQSYLDTLSDTVTLCRYDLPYLFADSSITAAGDYVFDFTTSLGCDSTHLNLTVIVNDFPQDTVNVFVCENDFPYAYGDTLIQEPGVYSLHIPDTVNSGCDTIRQFVINALQTYHDSLTVTVCENAPYMIGDSALTVPGTYDILLQSAQGCDSLVTVTLEHYPIFDQDTLNFTTCENDLPFVYGDTSFTTEGFHRIAYASEFGCDSIITINLMVLPIIYNADTLYESVCHSQLPYTTSFGETISHAGTYTYTTTSAVSGCDSVFYYHLTVYANPTPAINGQQHLCAGSSAVLRATTGMESYVWNNGSTSEMIEISHPSTYTVTVVDNHGCTGSTSFTVEEAVLPDIQLSSTQTICRGNSATISVSGADHYVWENGSTDASITVNPTATTSYHVTAYSALSCQREGYVTVVVNELPNAVISGPSEICQNGSAIFEADGGSTYQWSTGATSNIITLNTAGKYTVTVTDGNGCSDTTSKRLIVNALPNVTINGVSQFCQGQSTMLTASGAKSYIWSTADTGRTITTTYAGIYTVTGTDVHGCQSVANKQVSLHEITAVLTGNTFFCHNQSTTLSVSSDESYTYRWGNGSSASSLTVNAAGTYTVTVTNAMGCTLVMSQAVQENPLPTPSITGPSSICQGRSNVNLVAEGGVSYIWSNGSTSAFIPIVATGTYYVTVTDQNGCSASTSKTVIVNPQPIVNITSRANICQNETVAIYATTDATGAEYYWTTTGQSTPFINVTPTWSPSVYTVRVTDENGCSNTSSVTINVQSSPTVYLTGPTTICQGEVATFTAMGGVSYQWNNGMSTNSIDVNRAGQYSVTVSNAYGCSASSSAILSVDPIPAITMSDDTTICQGGSARLTAYAPGCTYHWSNNANSSSITVNQAGTYYVTATNNSTGCSNVASVTVSVNSKPTVSIAGVTAFCEGGNTVLTASTDELNTYTWSTGVSNAPLTVAAAGTYTITVTNVNGCSQTASTNVTMYTKPNPTISGVEAICPGSSATLTADLHQHYNWSTGDTTRSINVAPAGNTTYMLTVTDAHGCQNQTSASIAINPTPAVQITGNLAFCEGSTTELTATPGYTYSWSNTSTSQSITVNQAGAYTVTATNASTGCSNVATATVAMNAKPAISIIGSAAFCEGGSTTLSANTDEQNTYTWSTGTLNAPITVSTAGTYMITVTNANGCIQTASTNVTMYTKPTPAISGESTICPGSSATLTSALYNRYNWSTGDTSRSINVTPAATSTYTLTVTDAHGCQNQASATITIGSTPDLHITGNLAFCEGGTTQLTASPGYTYHWSDNSTNQSIIVSQAGTYSVTATNTNSGCSTVASVNVSLNAKPAISIAGATTFCEGGSTTLTANTEAQNTYIWSNNVANAPITVSTAGTYSITVTNANGCSQTATTNVTMYSKPTPVISGAGSICPGSTASLTASEHHQYSWSTGDTSRSINVTPAASTSYTLTVTDAHGCQNQTSAMVIIGSTPNLQISGNLTFCENGTTQLTTSPGYTYLWSNNSTAQSITVNQAGTYRVTATNALGCEAVDSVIVSTLPLPSVNFGMQHTICQGESYTYQLPGNSPLTYLWSNGSSSNVLTVSTAGTYTVTVTNEHGCSIIASDTLHISELPTPSIQGLTTICRGKSAILSAIGGVSYVWSDGSTTADILVSPQNTTIYAVTATNQYGCSASVSATVTVNALPSLTITGNRYFCDGGTTTLTASGASTYLWSTGSNSNNITISTPGTYFITVSNSLNCQKTDSVVIIRQDNPVITISGDNLICEGSNDFLTANGANTYSWSTGENTASILVSPTQTSIYTVTGTNAWGCQASVSKVVNVEASPTVHITGYTTICQGEVTTFTATGGTSYQWSTGSSSNQITAANAGIYSVTATSQHGCTNSTSAELTVNILPNVTISGPNTICEHTTETLTANGGVSYLWSDGSTDNTINISNSGTYSVTATNSFGCSSSATQSVNLLPAPQLTIAGATSLCQGGSTSLQAISNAQTYQWSTNETSQSINISPMFSTTYYVTVTNAAGCSNSDSLYITVNIPYQISFYDTICQGAAYARHGFNLPAQTEYGDQFYHNDLQSVTGCDSIITLFLYVKPLPVLPDHITGNSEVTTHGQFAYSVDDAQFVNSYEWRVSKPQWTLSSSNSNMVYLDIEQNGNGTLTAKAINGCGSTEISIDIYCNVGIDEYTNETNIVVYPVPTRDVLNINLEDAAANVRKIQLFDQRGRCLQTVNVDEFLMQLDCSSCAAGHYFVRFIDENGKTIDTRKIVVNR